MENFVSYILFEYVILLLMQTIKYEKCGWCIGDLISVKCKEMKKKL